MDCPKCGDDLEWNHASDAKVLTHTVSVDVVFSFNCPTCEWSAEVTMTNFVTQDELNEIYITEVENGD